TCATGSQAALLLWRRLDDVVRSRCQRVLHHPSSANRRTDRRLLRPRKILPFLRVKKRSVDPKKNKDCHQPRENFSQVISRGVLPSLPLLPCFFGCFLQKKD